MLVCKHRGQLAAMPNQNNFLAVALEPSMVDELHRVAKALEASTPEFLGLPAGATFDPIANCSLHLTFLFLGEFLRKLPADELRHLHAACVVEVQAALTTNESLAQTLPFLGFQLFPPGKANLVVARFGATEGLLQLRARILSVCAETGVSLPASYFSLIEGEGAWTPHVTLGKIGARRGDIGHASCAGARMRALALTRPLQPLGITLLGEAPPRASCDWTDVLSFGIADVEDGIGAEAVGDHDVASGGESTSAAAPSHPPSSSCPEALAWMCSLLGDKATRDTVAKAKFQEFNSSRSGLLEWTGCLRLSTHFTTLLGFEAPHQAKLHAAFTAANSSTAGALSEFEFLRFFRGLIKGLVGRKQTDSTASAIASRPQPALGPGQDLTPEVLASRWAELTWMHEVVQFKGSIERELGTPLRCLSNFYDEAEFVFEVPRELCAESLGLTDDQRRVRCGFSEKAIMLCKAAAMGDLTTYFKVAAAVKPAEAKQLGRAVFPWNADVWNQVVCSVAYHVIYQKFRQIDACRAVLLSTGESLIVEATRADAKWGVGIDKGDERIRRPSNWHGTNVLGWALVEVRARLRKELGSSIL